MELNDIQERLNEIRPDESEPSMTLETIMVKVGQMARGKVELSGAKQVPEEAEEEMYDDMFAGIILACFEYAEENDIDVESAVERRLEMMEEMAERREKILEAKEEGSASKLADALGADGNEVPTGILEDDEDENPRGVY